jgi:hypothetical protein
VAAHRGSRAAAVGHRVVAAGQPERPRVMEVVASVVAANMAEETTSIKLKTEHSYPLVSCR